MLWRRARPISGTLGEAYFREVRGVGCPLPPTMRFLPATSRHAAAIVTAFGLPSEPEPEAMDVTAMAVRAVHIIRIDRHGGKLEKRMLGSPAGLPLVVAPFREDGRGLVLTEGPEDALSAHEATGLAAWAGGSAAHLAKLAPAVPAHVESVVIVRDGNDAGHRATATLADALVARGIEVIVWGGARG